MMMLNIYQYYFGASLLVYNIYPETEFHDPKMVTRLQGPPPGALVTSGAQKVRWSDVEGRRSDFPIGGFGPGVYPKLNIQTL